MIEELKKLHVGKVIVKPMMKNYTTYKVGGPAKVMVIPNNTLDLIKLITYIKKNDIKHMVLGNGSNLIFSDELYDGIIIKLDNLDEFNVNGTNVTVGSGYSLIKLSMKVSKLGLTGLEFATGIPGTVGGAIYMNAGAYNSDMGYVVGSVTVLTPDLMVKTIYNKELDFHYRSSFFQTHKDYICLGATLHLRKGNAETILEVINERKIRRLESQPLEYPSAGSVFRNPENDYAGRLIEEAGLKGKYFGGAQVSEKHANFVINKNNATASDIRSLILNVRDTIKEKYNIELKIEQEFVD